MRTPDPKPTLSAAAMRDVSYTAVKAWNERRMDAFYGLFHPDLVHHSADGRHRHGLAELRMLYDGALALCPDLTITLTLVLADPESRLLASLHTESGTTATGERSSFQGMLFLRLGDDGLVHEAWEQTLVTTEGQGPQTRAVEPAR